MSISKYDTLAEFVLTDKNSGRELARITAEDKNNLSLFSEQQATFIIVSILIDPIKKLNQRIKTFEGRYPTAVLAERYMGTNTNIELDQAGEFQIDDKKAKLLAVLFKE